MTNSYKTKGIIIRRFSVGEADRLLDVYTPSLGKIKLKAKGIRRTPSKLSGHLEIFTETDLIVTKGKSLGIVTSARTLNYWKNIRTDLNITAIAFYFCELVYWLTEEGYKDTQLYRLLEWALATLNQVDSSDKTFLPLFIANVELLFLGRLGYQPELKKCAETGAQLKEAKNYFSAAAGGVVCERTRNSREISVATIKVLRLLTTENVNPTRWQQIEPSVQKEVRKVTREFVHYTIEKRLNTEGFLELTERWKGFD